MGTYKVPQIITIMIDKQYRIINNSLGWLMFIISAITYILTLEPTASFWDCPEFIASGYKLEVGHPPGAPIFMLTARFFANFASSPDKVALCVNTMSALLSAGTILLLFWSITHLTKRVLVKDDAKLTLWNMLIIFGSGVVGALAYTWSDTFWFSAVEGEVYAYSSFCTALVFWLILKWENRADEPHSDRYLILIAYIIGISIAVHLLNLLCIPAIVLVYYYRKTKESNVKGSLYALAGSFAIIVLILYGLVPGFVKVAQWFELFTVNGLGLPFNSGVVIYFFMVIGLFAWGIFETYRQTNPTRIKLSFLLSVMSSGMLFIGSSVGLGLALIALLIVWLFGFLKKIPIRLFSNVLICILVIFLGYSSYALILIRSSSNTPMDQNSPDDVFSLSTYLNREQYGDTPLLYGRTWASNIKYDIDASGNMTPQTVMKTRYYEDIESKEDKYKGIEELKDYKYEPELNMLFPRMFESNAGAISGYKSWSGYSGNKVPVKSYVQSEYSDGYVESIGMKEKPTYGDNIQYFFNYQLGHMYWRYFMWNFAGRQNDIQCLGEPNHGNWISGVPLIDNARLGDQSLLPDEESKDNKGHNVFYMLPLILGIIGLLWQAYNGGKRGIEGFWVVFFLFFMTGIAIVLYLNQPPSQPRERDYAFAGSFYAYAIWIGMGVAGIARGIMWMLKETSKSKAKEVEENRSMQMYAAIVACVLGVLVPIQMVSQTWDDHDRSGRYACRDFGMNYLAGLEPNSIIFTNGDNDTFPLWYIQEVEGYRTDVRVVNLSYLAVDWYINQMKRPAYDSPALPIETPTSAYTYGKRQVSYVVGGGDTPMLATDAMKAWSTEASYNKNYDVYTLPAPKMYIPVDAKTVLAKGIVPNKLKDNISDSIFVDFSNRQAVPINEIMAVQLLANSAKNGWNRPIYYAMTVSDNLYSGLFPYFQSVGMAYRVTPVKGLEGRPDTDKMYDVVMNKFRWGGIENSSKENPIYLDETVRRMVSSTRIALVELAAELTMEGAEALDNMGMFFEDNKEAAIVATEAQKKQAREYADDRFAKARKVLELMDKKLPNSAAPYGTIAFNIADRYKGLYSATKLEADRKMAVKFYVDVAMSYAKRARYVQSLPARLSAVLRAEDTQNPPFIIYSAVKELASIDKDAAVKLVNDITNMGVNAEAIIQRYHEADQEE